VFHLAVKPVQRSAGRSAVAAAAYRSGSLLEDRRLGDQHDYTRKSDIVHSEILVPAGALGWALKRLELWNAAEAVEKRKDACVARDYEVAIPRGLTREQGIELVRDFSQRLVDRYSVAADWNVHRDDPRKWDGSEKGWQGYHAHILTTTRRLGPEGFGIKSDAELWGADRKKRGLANSQTEELKAIRLAWEVVANRHLELAGRSERIDSRTLEEQGIERAPTVHLGPYVTDLERRGVSSRLGDKNRAIEAGARPAVRGMSYEAEKTLDEVKLQRLTADREAWVVRVIERAERREKRRERSLEAQTGRPWDVAKARATELLKQAKALTQRLREALEPRRLAAWARERVRGWTGSEAVGIERSARIEPTLQAVPPEDYLVRRRAEFRANREASRQRSAAEEVHRDTGSAQSARRLQDEAAKIRRVWAKEAEARRQAQEEERPKTEAAARQKALEDAIRQRALEDERRRRGVGLRGTNGLDKDRGGNSSGGSGRGGPER
jgi:hypothetical protein